tara:strand:- start:38794 stop:40245 length:1452 start_codon:yes stop_codon:yes gene_type:complete
MVKTIFGKKGKSLIFPVHCRAYVGIDYGDFFSSVNDDSDTYGIYSLKDESFTLEAYITPYESLGNPHRLGFGHTTASASSSADVKYKLSNVESDKVSTSYSRLIMDDVVSAVLTANHYLAFTEMFASMPTTTTTMSQNGRVMTIFHNKHVNLSLVNNAVTEDGLLNGVFANPHGYHPSEYKLRASIYAGGGYDTVVSKVVFAGVGNPSNSWSRTSNADPCSSDTQTIYKEDSKTILFEPVYYAQTRYLADDGSKMLLQIKRSTPNVAGYFEIRDLSSSNAVNSNAVSNLERGMELYTYEGVKIGKILDVEDTASLTSLQFFVDGNTETYVDDWSADWINVYTKPKKEAIYMFNSHMVALSFNYITGRIALFYNGVEVATKQHKYHPNSGESEAVDENDWSFSLSPSNCYIGKNVEHDTWDITTGVDYLIPRVTGISPLRTQFFGEFHELSISKGFNKTFSSSQSFDGKYNNLLLYYQFEGGRT